MIYKLFGYKLYKEPDTCLGYEKKDGVLVIHPVEAEIVSHLYEMRSSKEELKSDLPQHWVEYLEIKDLEAEELLKKYENIDYLGSINNLSDLHKFKISDVDIGKEIISHDMFEKIKEMLQKEQND